MKLDTDRVAEIEKYSRIYHAMPDYRMGDARRHDAIEDLAWAEDYGCRSYLDIGCGRGEMLAAALALGFMQAHGTEVVPELCGEFVFRRAIHDLDLFNDAAYEAVTSFDVIEHLLPGDDELLIAELGRISSGCIALTANNRPSKDPATGDDLHINIRRYDEWHEMITSILEPQGWQVHRCTGKAYVSETWRAWMD